MAMTKYTFSNGSFASITVGANGGILQVKKGTIALHIGSGTPDTEACITFGVGEKWIFQGGLTLRATSLSGPMASAVVGDL